MKYLIFSLVLLPLFAQAQLQGRLVFSENTFYCEKDVYWIVDSTDGVYTVSRNGYLGLVSKEGKLLADARFDAIEPFTQEATVITSKGKYGIMNKKGELIASCQYTTIKPFGCSITAFEKDNRWGLIDIKGKIVAPNIYYNLSSFHDGMGVAMNIDAEYLLIDSTGKTSTLFHRDKSGIPRNIIGEMRNIVECYSLENNKGALYFYHDSIAKGLNMTTFKYCYVDKAGNRLFDKDFEDILPFEGKYAEVKTDKGWNLIDRNGIYKFDTWFITLNTIPKGDGIITKRDSLYGVIDAFENVLIPFKYQNILALNDSLFAVCLKNNWGQGSKWGVVNLNNESILPCIYEGISFDSKTGIGKAGIYDNSIALNTGVPRYKYFGHYYFFDHVGIIDKKEHPYSMLVEGISDWHTSGNNVLNPGTYAPDLDEHNYGIIVSEASKNTISPSISKTIKVTNSNGKEILSTSETPFIQVKVYPNCIVVRANTHSIVYDHFGNRIFKTKYAILDRNDNGTLRMFRAGGNPANQYIDAQGNSTE
jgi:hypothetical protein